MPSARRPLLIVPIRDRRQRRRILTVKNCAMTMLAFAVVFAAISIYSEARKGTAGEYGRLFGSQVGAPPREVSRNVPVVEEGAVADQAAPDPMLIAPAAKERLLLAGSNVDQPPAPAVEVPPLRKVPATVTTDGAHGTAIVGDRNGVVVAHAPASSTAPPPPLSGGIFKQQ